MICLHCGDCCLRMSPLSEPNPCPHIIQDGDFVFCGCYQIRPEKCENHGFPFKICPVGMEKLGLKTWVDIVMRVDAGWHKIQVLERRAIDEKAKTHRPPRATRG